MNGGPSISSLVREAFSGAVFAGSSGETGSRGTARKAPVGSGGAPFRRLGLEDECCVKCCASFGHDVASLEERLVPCTSSWSLLWVLFGRSSTRVSPKVKGSRTVALEALGGRLR